jgi:hypothetical protein
MEARRVVLGDGKFKVKYHFDPRGMSHENWEKLVYPDVKLFIDDMTKENFKQLLEEHRNLYDERDKKRSLLARKYPDLFKFCKDRLFPLKENEYKKIRDKLKKRYKMESPVIEINGKGVKIKEEKDVDSQRYTSSTESTF